eukprot:04520.XXX_149909_150013_1 [CDS] Oithona nana genome sequencing.
MWSFYFRFPFLTQRPLKASSRRDLLSSYPSWFSI